ncbi:hypothetical protein [Amycolatopsis sp. YIM 10]|uniref:hypothetical protein n=1 Tax=Amycolatopsis sp. YIM 10 TaxID=2653857 RepID=UPI001290705D|nr:hypothetical protein [Amycolatopsis sp. YIM 10]QFU87838.1 hypothetical protein YIM_13260 [Amycolatopsis sp. YIM 10]QFU94849.1 hypothetical protein YIM_48620 [Amycolatopsis sp. YIM 10]
MTDLTAPAAVPVPGDLAALVGRVVPQASAGRHRRHDCGEPTEILPALGELTVVDELRAMRGVVVTVDPHFAGQQCEWCQQFGAVTSVRIYGEPAPDTPYSNPLDVAETCGCRACALGAVNQALTEQDRNSNRDIRVEVAG